MIDKIRNEINSFLYDDIEIVNGVYFNQYETIKRVHAYINSKFFDAVPQGSIFHNIVKSRKTAVARFLNIDTKDIKLLPTNPKSEFSTYFLEQELKQWLKKNKIGQLLNEIADSMTTYGSAVIRKTAKGAETVDLRRLFIDPSVKSIVDSRFITIKHILTPSQLRAKVKDGWDSGAIERIITAVEEEAQSRSPESYEDEGTTGVQSTPLIEVYERYGEIDADEYKELTGKSTKKDYMPSLVIVAEPLKTKTSINLNGEEYQENVGEILYADKWSSKYPFQDLHFSRQPGRWLGVGIVEDLFEAQERINELENQKRLAMELSALQLFQVSGASAVQNVLTDLVNGDVIVAKDGFNPVDTRVKDLSSFRDEYETYNTLADRISFANDLVSGQAIPASTPATNALIQNNNATSVLLFKRENLALFLQEFFNDLVLPQVLNDLSKEHIVRYIAEAGTGMLELIDQVYINQKKVETLLNSNKPISPEQEAAIEFDAREELSKTGNVRYARIKDNLYDDLEFEFDILIANEQENVAIIAQNTFSLIQAFAQNPQLLQDPVFKTLFFDYAQRIGINPARLEAADAKKKPMTQAQTLTGGIDQLQQKVQDRIANQAPQAPETVASVNG